MPAGRHTIHIAISATINKHDEKWPRAESQCDIGRHRIYHADTLPLPPQISHFYAIFLDYTCHTFALRPKRRQEPLAAHSRKYDISFFMMIYRRHAFTQLTKA